MGNFNILICLKSLDSGLLSMLIAHIRAYIKPLHIIIITSKNNNLDSIMRESSKDFLPHSALLGAKWLDSKSALIILDENKIAKDLSLESIQGFLAAHNASVARAGWYLQQFLKMAFSRFIYAKSYENTNIAGGGG